MASGHRKRRTKLQMTNKDRQFEILDEIARAAIQSAEGEYDELVVEMEFGEGSSGSASYKMVKGVREPLYIPSPKVLSIDYPNVSTLDYPDVLDLGYELLQELRKRSGRSNLRQYTVRVDKDGKASANFEDHDLPLGTYFDRD